MKYLILVRHGEYEKDGQLNIVGQEQMLYLAEKIKKYIINNRSVAVFSSPTDRTSESAKIISKYFGVNFEVTNALLSDGFDHPMNLSRLFEFVKSKDDIDTVILVTHFDYVAYFPKYFSSQMWGVDLPSTEIGKGNAWLVDCQKKILLLLN